MHRAVVLSQFFGLLLFDFHQSGDIAAIVKQVSDGSLHVVILG
jgi:hypothetical protein